MLEESFDFSCPVCGELLVKENGTMRCRNGHCFDIAKQGYVNLLQSQKSSSKRHGDDKLMVKSRSDFLNKGYYDILAENIVKLVGKKYFPGMKILDIGCGECFYTSRLEKAFSDAVYGGIDISKQALIAGCKRSEKFSLAVASAFKLPVANDSCDLAMTVFAPHGVSEIHRVLKDGGVWLRAYPLERHLLGLKSVIYEKPYLNDVDRTVSDGFELWNREEVKDRIYINGNEDIINLFSMTPYYYKTGRADQEKLDRIDSLETEIEFGIDLLIKR